MIEIYNEELRDLLSERAERGGTGSMYESSASASSRKSRDSKRVTKGDIHAGTNATLEIRRDAAGRLVLPGLNSVAVHNARDVMTAFGRGMRNRTTASTNMDADSSRSHCIMLVDVTTTTKGSAPTTGRLYLVDLAGSERVAKSGVTGKELREAQHINKSLAALGDVMASLDKKSEHIPYRNSKLTYLLQDALSGNARAMMVAEVRMSEVRVDAT